jgi:hypothetical protein
MGFPIRTMNQKPSNMGIAGDKPRRAWLGMAMGTYDPCTRRVNIK